MAPRRDGGGHPGWPHQGATTLIDMDTHAPTTAGPRRKIGRAVAITLGLSVAAAVGTWGLVGPQRAAVHDPSGQGVVDDERDYVLRAPDVDPDVERAVGTVALAVAVAVAVVALRPSSAAPAATARAVAVVTALLAGVIVGGGGRIVTAGVIGANIGAGLVLLVGLPVAAVLLVVAVGAMTLRSGGRRPDG